MQSNFSKSRVAIEQRVLRKLKGTGKRLMRRGAEYFVQDYAQQEAPQHFSNVFDLARGFKVLKSFEALALTDAEVKAIDHAEKIRSALDKTSALLEEYLDFRGLGISEQMAQREFWPRAEKLYKQLLALKEMKAA